MTATYNWGRNPFTGIYYPYTIPPFDRVVQFYPEKGAFGVQLPFVPLITSPASFRIEDLDLGGDMTEVPRSLNPSVGDFRVDYEAVGQLGTSFVEMNAADNGKNVRIHMKASARSLTDEGLLLALHDVFDPIIASLQASDISIGSVYWWPDETPPPEGIEANGAAYSRTTYAALFAKYGTKFGPGDGSTTFNVPDLRGEFLRGWDHGRGKDPDAASRTDRGDGTTGDHVGTKQADTVGPHAHTMDAPQYYLFNLLIGAGPNGLWFNNTGPAAGSTGSSGGSETRPTNVSGMWVIKFK